MKPAIEVRGIGKRYTINHKNKASYSTLKDDFGHLFTAPFSKRESKEEHFWALKNVSFDVMPGEIFGVIGRNGSGKSTLLKILSRIVDPTEGHIKLHGKTASLLEVGTGFHPELTGRENIYFNGSMIGMSRVEIQSKFNDIVDFSEVEKFIDTPVKFYSSGMYVRLAFSVAAYLEPDILILDEVLAVGDARFQQKSLNKILKTMEEGRTVIFVSHSMDAVRKLCSCGLLLENGAVEHSGNIDELIERYTGKPIEEITLAQQGRIGRHNVKIASLDFIDTNQSSVSTLSYNEPLNLKIKLDKKLVLKNVRFDINIFNQELARVACLTNLIKPTLKECDEFVFFADRLPLADGMYSINVSLHQENDTLEDFIPSAKTFRIKRNANVINGVSGLIYLNGEVRDA
jgi:lipopolysaccharide transport system ATP-binding protein